MFACCCMGQVCPNARDEACRSLQPDMGSLLPQRCTGALHAALPDATSISFAATAGEGRRMMVVWHSLVQTILEFCPGEPTAVYRLFQDFCVARDVSFRGLAHTDPCY